MRRICWAWAKLPGKVRTPTLSHEGLWLSWCKRCPTRRCLKHGGRLAVHGWQRMSCVASLAALSGRACQLLQMQSCAPWAAGVPAQPGPGGGTAAGEGAGRHSAGDCLRHPGTGQPTTPDFKQLPSCAQQAHSSYQLQLQKLQCCAAGITHSRAVACAGAEQVLCGVQQATGAPMKAALP